MMGALHHNENYSCGNILFPYPDGLEMQLQMPDEGQPLAGAQGRIRTQEP
jgi:hypothetical protein